MNAATPSSPGYNPGQWTTAEPRIPGNNNSQPRRSVQPRSTGMAGRVAEAIEQALAAAPGDVAWGPWPPAQASAVAGLDADSHYVPAWWLDMRARVEQDELDHRADAATEAAALDRTQA